MNFKRRMTTSPLEELTDAVLDSINRVNEIADHIVLPDLSSFRCVTDDFSNVIEERFKSVKETLQQFSESWAINYANALRNLDLYAEEGWFVETADVHIADLFSLINGEYDCSAMSEYYRSQLDRIEQDLLARHPKRHRTIAQVFSAHRNEWYDLTCTTIFSLVDGICWDEEVLNVKFFDKNSENNYTLRLVEKMNEVEAGEIFIHPLISNKPIFSHEDDLDSFPCKLNRHAIIHGKDADYGTEINSLKSISLLAYISDLVTYSKDITNRKNGK